MVIKRASSFFWIFLKRRKILVSLYAFLSGSIGLFGVFNAYLLKIVIDRLSSSGGLRELLFPLCFLAANSEVHNVLWRGINLVCLKILPSSKSEMTSFLFDCAHKKPYPFFQQRLSGSIAQDIAIVTDAFERIVTTIGVRLIRGGAQLVVSLILMSLIHFEYALIFLGWTLSFATISALVSKKIRSHSRNTARAHSEVIGQLVDSFSGAKEVKLFSGAARESHRLNRFLERWKDAYSKKGRFFLKFYLLQGFSITCLVCAMAFLLIQQQAAGIVTTGDFVYILSATFLLVEMIWANTELIDQSNEQMGRCTQSLLHLLQEENDQPVYSGQDIVKEGAVSFESIAFSYVPDRPLFEEVSLQVAAGEKVGVVGKSGAGKSTLIHLLLKFYSPDRGRITIDGQDIAAVSHEALYRSIAVVSQNPALFRRSLIENVRFSHQKASNAEVIEAIRLAGLIKFQDIVDVSASQLSGGEQQRVAIARALLKNARILILDEPTSQLDALTQREVIAALYPLMEGRTTIAITHNLSLLTGMDKVIVLQEGKIVEEGGHCELLQQQGEYARLWGAASMI